MRKQGALTAHTHRHTRHSSARSSWADSCFGHVGCVLDVGIAYMENYVWRRRHEIRDIRYAANTYNWQIFRFFSFMKLHTISRAHDRWSLFSFPFFLSFIFFRSPYILHWHVGATYTMENTFTALGLWFSFFAAKNFVVSQTNMFDIFANFINEIPFGVTRMLRYLWFWLIFLHTRFDFY